MKREKCMSYEGMKCDQNNLMFLFFLFICFFFLINFPSSIDRLKWIEIRSKFETSAKLQIFYKQKLFDFLTFQFFCMKEKHLEKKIEQEEE